MPDIRALLVLRPDDSTSIPIGSTKRPDVVNAVASAVLAEIDTALGRERNETLRDLLAQERHRLAAAMATLGTHGRKSDGQ